MHVRGHRRGHGAWPQADRLRTLTAPNAHGTSWPGNMAWPQARAAVPSNRRRRTATRCVSAHDSPRLEHACAEPRHVRKHPAPSSAMACLAHTTAHTAHAPAGGLGLRPHPTGCGLAAVAWERHPAAVAVQSYRVCVESGTRGRGRARRCGGRRRDAPRGCRSSRSCPAPQTRSTRG